MMNIEDIEQIAKATARYQMILSKEFLSIREAAIYMDCKEEFVRSLVRVTGNKPPLITSYSLGTKYISIRRSDIDDYIKSNPRRKSQAEIGREFVKKII